MPEDSGDEDGATARFITRNSRVRKYLLGLQVVAPALILLSLLAIAVFPDAIEMAIQTIHGDSVVAVFILCAAPFYELLLWKLHKEIPRDGYWGFLFAFMGIGILVLNVAVLSFLYLFMPALLQTSPLLVGALVVIGAGGTMAALGLLLVFAQIVRPLIQLFREGR